MKKKIIMKKKILKKYFFKESKPHKYTSGLYRNNSHYNLKKPIENNIKKHNIYYNYGPIYSYERAKELKYLNSSSITNEKENRKKKKKIMKFQYIKYQIHTKSKKLIVYKQKICILLHKII